ncbi:MAG: DUF2934 domain-containing protein [Candidatus Contendobacter sp.]|nr:DUF2934 domain-containing protein [Candidatus Contendobacter sp.]
MESDLEPKIRNLAYHLWQTAGREFGQTALDFWAMAERMVVEMTVDSIRRANAATATAVENAAVWPSALRALYHYRVRELAQGMWAASAEQRDRALDFWLAAEQHLRLLAESAARTAGTALGREETLARTFEMFSPADYLEQIRKAAYQLWETAENRHQSALKFWLAAENQFMESLAAGGATVASPCAHSPVGTSTT